MTAKPYGIKKRTVDLLTGFVVTALVIGAVTGGSKLGFHFGDLLPGSSKKSEAATQPKGQKKNAQFKAAAKVAVDPEEAAEEALVAQAVKSLRVSERERALEIERIKTASVPSLMDKLKARVTPLQTKDGRALFAERESKASEAQAAYYAREVRSGVLFAVNKGVWDTTISVCAALKFSPDDAFALAMFESSMGKDGLNKDSRADGIYQVLEGAFLEMFARHGRAILPIVQELDAKTAHEMKPLVGMIRMASKGSTGSEFAFDAKAYKEYIGKKANKLSQAEIEKDIMKRILALRSPGHKDVARRGVVSTCMALWDLCLKVPAGRNGLACMPRLVHNYGQRGGTAMAEAYKKTPKKTMFDVMMVVYEKSISDKDKRVALVEKLLHDNGMRTKTGQADTHVTVGAFVGTMERSWSLTTNCFAQWREKMQIAQGLNEHLQNMKAPLKVVWDPDEKILFSLVSSAPAQSHAAKVGPVRNDGKAPSMAQKGAQKMVLARR